MSGFFDEFFDQSEPDVGTILGTVSVSESTTGLSLVNPDGLLRPSPAPDLSPVVDLSAVVSPTAASVTEIGKRIDHERQASAAALSATPTSVVNGGNSNGKPRTRSLWRIQESMDAFDNLLDELTDEQLEDFRAELNEWFAELGAERTKKLDGYASYIERLEGLSLVRDAEANRLKSLAAKAQAAADFLRRNLKEHLEHVGEKKIETDRHRLTVCKNGGKQPLKLPKKLEDLPAKYRHQIASWKLNEETLRHDLAEGVEVEGAALLERGTHLRIA